MSGLTTNPKAGRGRKRPKTRWGGSPASSKVNKEQGAALRTIRARVLALEGKLAVLASALDFEFDPGNPDPKPLILEEE